MERQLTISECCEMISELAGDIDGVVYFLNCIREREEKLVIQIDIKNAEIDDLKKVIERKDGALWKRTSVLFLQGAGTVTN